MLFRTIIASLLIAGTHAAPVAAAPSPVVPARVVPARVVLAVDGTDQLRNLPVVLAERLGYFRDAGVTVTLVNSPADPSPAQLMKDGRADGAVAFYHHTFMSQVDDATATEAVVVMGATPQLKLLVATRLRDRVKTLADLRGLKIYTGGSNSGKTTSMNWLATRAGFGVAGYTALPLAPRAAMAAALANGTADAVMAHEPDASGYIKSGAAFMLADLSSVPGTRASLGNVYPSTSIYFSHDYVTAHHDDVQRVVDATLRAVRYIAANSPEQIASVLPAKLGSADRAAFIAQLAEDKQAFATDGKLIPAAAQEELAAMAALNPKYGRVRLDATYTNAFVEGAAIK